MQEICCKRLVLKSSVSLAEHAQVFFFPLWQDESSSSEEDDDDEDWGSDTVESGSESSDEGDEKSASLAKVFLKKWVLVKSKKHKNKM